ncbi:MAG: Hsp20/alpha crystallin family protein [Candidatus Shapirobacteria bacterium]
MDSFPFKSLWMDEDEWPELKINQGLNVFEEDNMVVVQASVPGVPADKVKVTYEGGVLRITARMEEGEETKKRGRTIHQWSKVASFDYASRLPKPIDSKSVDAEIKDGIVTVKAKVAEEAKAKEIPLRSAK